jgi:hypothetical protein
MCGSQLEWPRRRKAIANGVASILHGVVAIMSAELGLQPGWMPATKPPEPLGNAYAHGLPGCISVNPLTPQANRGGKQIPRKRLLCRRCNLDLN